MEQIDIQTYMTAGVENVIKNAVRVTLADPAQSMFIAGFAIAAKKASAIRKKYEENGEHIPAFLIASITSSCNLHCTGCYARAVHSCTDTQPIQQLTAKEWDDIFAQAEELGISFILLAGGEPMIRKDVIEKAGDRKNILFPIFTNGTLLDENYYFLLKKHRNLIPIFSIEGKQQQTDVRRGNGVYESVYEAMERLYKDKLLFGASVTVTKQNLQEVMSDSFVEDLIKLDCKVLIYVEFVPVTPEDCELAPEDRERKYLKERLTEIRTKYQGMIFLSFPGDEKTSGGCIAAGRGFFHINSHGGAEPCPFSPYSDVNVRDTSLLEALHSGLFQKLKDSGALLEDHAGGCVLFEKKEEVEAFLTTGGRNE